MADASPRLRLVVEADGGSRGNPGVAGYGAVVRDADTGAVLVERAAPLGRRSNNVAEYRGLLAGLEAALALAGDRPADVLVRMDSKLVVEQMSGRWKVKHEDMRALAAEGQALVRRIVAAGGSVRYEWVPRSQNGAADRLSNVGMDGRTVDTLADAIAGHASPDATQAAELASGASVAPTAGSSDVTPPALGGAIRLLFLRHGVTDFTAQNRLDGRGGADPPLNAEGRAQAHAAAGAVRGLVDGPVRVVSSSLARARQTAEPVAAALTVEPVVDADWDEQAFGDWDGAVFTELAERSPDELTRLWLERDYARPGGESMADLEARVLPAYERAVSMAGTEGGTVVVVTSRKPLLVVLAHLLGMTGERFWALSTDPGSLTAVELWPDGRLSVPFVNRQAAAGYPRRYA